MILASMYIVHVSKWLALVECGAACFVSAGRLAAVMRRHSDVAVACYATTAVIAYNVRHG